MGSRLGVERDGEAERWGSRTCRRGLSFNIHLLKEFTDLAV